MQEVPMSHRTRRAIALAAGMTALTVISAGATADARTVHTHGSARYSSADEQWLMTAIEGDRFEIQGGKMAEDKGTTAAVRALGARLIKDHSSSLAQAAHLARQLGIDVPASPSPSQAWELRTVGSFAGAVFDRSYADLELSDHKQDIQEGKDEWAGGLNHAIRHLAHGELPTLREHLKLAQAALQAAGG
jgi:putative membrane protein